MNTPADDAEVSAARSRVERLAAAPSPAPAELAAARLALSRALDAADHPLDAMSAAEDGISGLAPAFHARPGELAESMRALVAQYLAAARCTDRAPDRALLMPLAASLGGVVTAEDEAEEAAVDDAGGEAGDGNGGSDRR